MGTSQEGVEVKVYVVYENLGVDGCSEPKAVRSSMDKAQEWIADARLDPCGSYGFKVQELELDERGQ